MDKQEHDMTTITQKQTLIRVNNLLEQALRESMHIKAPNTIDVQINRIRAELRERIAVQNKLQATTV